MNPAEIGELRKNMGLSQADFGRLFGVHVMTVSRWERGLLTPTAYQTALMQSFRVAVVKDRAKVQQQLEALLIGAGVVAALLLLLKTAEE